jgi:hypothetical protein
MSPIPSPALGRVEPAAVVDAQADFQSIEEVVEEHESAPDLIGLDLADEIQKLLDEAGNPALNELTTPNAQAMPPAAQSVAAGASRPAIVSPPLETASPGAVDEDATAQELSGLKEALDELLDVAQGGTGSEEGARPASADQASVSAVNGPGSASEGPAAATPNSPADEARVAGSPAAEERGELDLSEFQSMQEIISGADSQPASRPTVAPAAAPSAAPAPARLIAQAPVTDAKPEAIEPQVFLSVDEAAQAIARPAQTAAGATKPEIPGPVIHVEASTSLASVDEMLAEKAGQAVAHESASMPELLVHESGSPDGQGEACFVDPAQVEAELRAILDQSVRATQAARAAASARSVDAPPAEAEASPDGAAPAGGRVDVRVMRDAALRFLLGHGRRAISTGLRVGGAGAKAACTLISRPILDKPEARQLVGYAALVTLANSVALVLYRFLLS